MTARLTQLTLQHTNGVLGTGLVRIIERTAFQAAERRALLASIGFHDALLSRGAAALRAQAVRSDGMGAERDRSFGGEEGTGLPAATGQLLAARCAAIAVIAANAAQVAALLRVLLDRGGLALRGAAALEAHHVLCA